MACRGGKSCESKHYVCLCVKCVTVYPLLGKSSFIIWLCGLFITVNNRLLHAHMTIQTVHSSGFPQFHPAPQLNLQGNLSVCRAVSRTDRAHSFFISDRLILFMGRSIREDIFLWQHHKGKSRAGHRSIFKHAGSVNCALYTNSGYQIFSILLRRLLVFFCQWPPRHLHKTWTSNTKLVA